VWNIFNTNSSDPAYGMLFFTLLFNTHTIVILGICSQLSPWTPIARGQTLKMVLALTNNFQFVKQDPTTTGVYILQDNTSQTLVVWQNRPAWTSLLGNAFVIENILSQQTWLGVYSWNGLRQTIRIFFFNYFISFPPRRSV
jgi:hypothetical protein